MLQGELKRFQSVIKTDDFHFFFHVADSPKKCERVGGASQADVPDDELVSAFLNAADKVQLLDIKRLSFSGGADDRMERLAVGFGAQAERTICKADDVIKV